MKVGEDSGPRELGERPLQVGLGVGDDGLVRGAACPDLHGIGSAGRDVLRDAANDLPQQGRFRVPVFREEVRKLFKQVRLRPAFRHGLVVAANLQKQNFLLLLR